MLKATSISESLLAYWAKMGVLRADGSEGEGAGRHRRFSLTNLFEIELAARLSRSTSLDSRKHVSENDRRERSEITDVLLGLRHDQVWDSLESADEEPRRDARLLLVCFYSQAALEFHRQQNPQIAAHWPRFYCVTTSHESASIKIASEDWMTESIAVIDLVKLVDRVTDAAAALKK